MLTLGHAWYGKCKMMSVSMAGLPIPQSWHMSSCFEKREFCNVANKDIASPYRLMNVAHSGNI